MIAGVTSATALPGRLLDLAFPARCPGCGLEGAPICAQCAGALDARLDRPAGVSIGLPSDVPSPLLQLEWCAPFGGAERRRRRGYDQAELIAAAAASALRLPMAPLLERSRATTAQFDLDRRSRATNVLGAFRLRPGA